MPTILAIDDDESYGPFLKRHLETLGFNPTVVRTGAEGVEICKISPPDLIVLDWCLKKGLSGRETLSIFKSQPSTRHIPVVVISGLREGPEDEREVRQAGAAQFLTKAEIADSLPQRQVLQRRLMSFIRDRKNQPVAAAPKPARAPRMRSVGRVLVIEDDPEMAGMVSFFLGGKGCKVLTAGRGVDGVKLAQHEHPDLVILDLGLPDLDGLEVCARLKADARTRSIPVMVLTARTSTQTKLQAIEYSADYFLAKPIMRLDDFHKWVSALLRRKSHAGNGKKILRIGDLLVIDIDAHTVNVGERVIEDLPATLFRLLCEFVQQPGQTLPRPRLVRRVWRNHVADHNVDTAVDRLKKRLGPPVGDWFVCVPGLGFRLQPASSLASEKSLD